MTVEPTGPLGVGSASAVRDWGARPVGPGWGPELIAEKIRVPSSAQKPSTPLVEPTRLEWRLGAMLAAMRSLPFAVLSVLLFGCSSGAIGTDSPPTPSPSNVATPTSSGGGFGAIEHASGSTDVVLRFEQGGGFVAPAFLATQAPIFTLYGDGTVIFRNPTQDPLPAVGSVFAERPFRTAILSEDQIQKVLEDALGRGGLGTARSEYLDMQIADAPTSTFTINAGGLTKRVSVYALGIDAPDSPDAPARAAFEQLAERLQDFDSGGTFPTNEYAPERFRGILVEGQPGAPDVKAWPWSHLKPADFVSNPDPNAFQLPTRVLTVAEVETLDISAYRGGFQGLSLTGPSDGKTYTLSIRPLLPDEPN